MWSSLLLGRCHRFALDKDEPLGDSLASSVGDCLKSLLSSHQHSKKFDYHSQSDCVNSSGSTGNDISTTYDAALKLSKGIGCKLNLTKALQLFHQLASQNGHAPAQNDVAYFYERGVASIPKDPDMAFRLYSWASMQNHPKAQNNLGYCFKTGVGTPIDLTKAALHYGLSAEQGYANAQHNYANALFHGTGTPVDLQKAFLMYSRAADSGNVSAMNSVADMLFGGLGVEKNPAAAVAVYRKAAKRGCVPAMYGLAQCLERGIGVPEKNPTEAFNLYETAAKRGDARAQNAVGTLYLNGVGVEKDHLKAVEWYMKSAEAGYPPANGQRWLVL
ncbi:hypothetical protein BC829DRAFT_178207 [Chytridium lagenaria]|nr:hypothetical protein BC829DRAFT_178207 [Chytridium lagenaria]